MRLADLAKAIEAELFLPETVGPDLDQRELSSVAPIHGAKQHQLTFVNSAAYEKYLDNSEAGAVILDKPKHELPMPQLIHRNPYWAFALAAQRLHPPQSHGAEVSEQATIHPSAKVGAGCRIYPGAYLGENVQVGERTVLFPGVFLGKDVVVGSDTEIRANTIIEYGCRVGDRVLIHGGSVIGADGFGFAPSGKGPVAKIPQIGAVVIEDDVEIGAVTSIDRGAMEDTVIGKGTKVDSQVQIAHGVNLGQHCMICGGSAIAGTAKLHDNVIVGGHSAVADHTEISSGVIVGGHSGVTKSLKDPGVYHGFPARPTKDWAKEVVGIRRLAKMEERLRKLERELAAARSD